MDRFLGPLGQDEQPDLGMDLGTSMDQGSGKEEESLRAFGEDALGLKGPALDLFMNNAKAQDAFIQQYARKNTGNPDMSPEEVSAWLPEHIQKYGPMLASRNRSIQSLGRTLAARDDKDFRKGSGSSNTVRDQIKSQLPQNLHHLVDALDDRGLSMLAGKQLEEGIETAQQGGIGYRQEKGAPRLKIVQDEAFMRAGYKSGDTVCVKIP